MPHEGMVDALRRALHLLRPDGVLIDLHPTPDTPQLDVVARDGAAERVGPLQSEAAAERHRNADGALATAVAERLFTIERASVFRFRRYCNAVDELADHVNRKWTTRFDDELAAKARRALRPGRRLCVWEDVSITALRPSR
jgi:hypothetical protein